MNEKIIPISKNVAQSRLGNEQILKVQEVANIMRVSASSVYALVRKHELKSIRVGRAIRIRRQDIQDYLGIVEL